MRRKRRISCATVELSCFSGERWCVEAKEEEEEGRRDEGEAEEGEQEEDEEDGEEVRRSCLKGEEERSCEEGDVVVVEEGDEDWVLRSMRVSSPRLGGASEPEVVLRGLDDVATNRSATRKRVALGRSGVVGLRVVESVVAVAAVELPVLSLARCLSVRLRCGVANLMGGLLIGGVEGCGEDPDGDGLSCFDGVVATVAVARTLFRCVS